MNYIERGPIDLLGGLTDFKLLMNIHRINKRNPLLPSCPMAFESTFLTFLELTQTELTLVIFRSSFVGMS